ncbi:MAG TPA: DUF3846 domain-containing protein [Desulfosporosinus sp.]|nr:DUF3846 domain-containing protein [Desulfosporosinus sp.]
MKVLVAESGIRQLEELNIEIDLASMQSLVGGFIELATHPALQGYIIVANEDGMRRNLKLNVVDIVGAFFISKTGDDGEVASLDNSDVLTIKKVWESYYTDPPTDSL